MADILNAFTVDVEDYYHVSAFERVVDRASWGERESRVERNTERLLELLAAREVSGTFFVLGWVARRFPALVRRIAEAGHELASHSFWHRLVYELSPEEFRRDLRDSRSAIEDASGHAVTSYRAPSFSITQASLWALDILAEEGFDCDSSVFPIHHDRYGIPNADRFLHRRQTAAGPLWEFPATTARWGSVNLPIAGGGYFRLYPWTVTARMLRSFAATTGEPFVFYTHPWEIDAAQPRISGIDLRSRFRHYVNLARTESKLERLLRSFRFGRLRDVIQQRQAATTEPIGST
ncbi:MAG: DUF3473 domain-containing protein [Pirellulales bacterium]|nr:DUF3473 domain-containing protein [Pirellulales bacterium]